MRLNPQSILSTLPKRTTQLKTEIINKRTQSSLNSFAINSNTNTNLIQIQSITNSHFKLTNDLNLFFNFNLLIPISSNSNPLIWKISNQINQESLQIFKFLYPRPGTGERLTPIDPSVREWIHSLGIQLTVLDTRNAASTYNLLIDEGRSVGVGLQAINPPKSNTSKN
ncbi:NADH dehydrogenase 1 alpha subcomplex assembly factor 3 [Melampsora americana]|nr:NADH dehydrogenase 1 alpha subcomplex assembly factor 3 [Melampsora americana]